MALTARCRVPVSSVVRVQRRALREAGVVDEHVDLAQLGEDAVHRVLLGDIADKGRYRPSHAAMQFGGEALERALVTSQDRDAVAGGGEADHHCTADPLAAAGDHHRTAQAGFSHATI